MTLDIRPGMPMKPEPLKPVVQIRTKNVYGRQLVYPLNDNAKRFAALAKKETLDKRDLNLIIALGFELQETIQSEVAEILK